MLGSHIPHDQGDLPPRESASGGVYIRSEGGLPPVGSASGGGLHPDPPGSGCRPTCHRHRYPHILPGLDESQVVNPGFVGDANI